MRELIIGGARSGKSTLAEKRALESGLPVVYIATAQSLDGEMQRRIALHQARRPAEWGLVEAPLPCPKRYVRTRRMGVACLSIV